MGQLFGEMGQHYLVTDVCRENGAVLSSEMDRE